MFVIILRLEKKNQILPILFKEWTEENKTGRVILETPHSSPLVFLVQQHFSCLCPLPTLFEAMISITT